MFDEFSLPNDVIYTSVIKVNGYLSDTVSLSNNNWDKEIKKQVENNNKKIIQVLEPLLKQGWSVVNEKGRPVSFVKDCSVLILKDKSFCVSFTGTQRAEWEILTCLGKLPHQPMKQNKKMLLGVSHSDLEKIYQNNIHMLEDAFRCELGEGNSNRLYEIASNLYNRIGLQSTTENRMNSHCAFYKVVRGIVHKMEDNNELMIEEGCLKPVRSMDRAYIVLARKLNDLKEYTLRSKSNHVLMRFTVVPNVIDIGKEQERCLMDAFIDKHKNMLSLFDTKKDITPFVEKIWKQDFESLYRKYENLKSAKKNR